MGYLRTINEWFELDRGLVAVWKLLDDGHSDKAIRAAVAGLREVHDGVYLSGHAPITDWQRWRAGTLTQYGTVLSDWSGAAFRGMREGDRWPTTVKRYGSGGPVVYPAAPARLGSLRVARTTVRFREDTVVTDGIPAFTVPRLAVELSAKLGPEKCARMVRDILRLKLATGVELRAQLALHLGWRGTKDLRKFVDQYAALPAARTRSDAEILAVALLSAAGYAVPAVNVVIGGKEADLVDPARRLILELDGPQYHQFAEEDERKSAIWRAAGFVVRRLPTDGVYVNPHLLFDEWTRPISAAERATTTLPRLRAA